MQVYSDGRLRICDGEIDIIHDSFAILLMSAIIYYRDFQLSGEDMLITFSDEEEKMICDQSRKLLKNRCAQPNEADENHEKTLFAKALQAMISTIPINSMQTLTLCTYIKSVVRTSESRRIGILYHSFSTHQRVEQLATSVSIYPIELTMKV
jgi:beta-phosphoglucomutase-like phosphatase (HAD superfamily)